MKAEPLNLENQGSSAFIEKSGKHLYFLHYRILHVAGKISAVSNEYEEDEKPSQPDGRPLKHQVDREAPPPPPPSHKNHLDSRDKQVPSVARAEEDDIFVGDGIDYAVPGKDINHSPVSEEMEESPRNRERPSYFNEPVYGPVPPSEPSQDWQQTVS